MVYSQIFFVGVRLSLRLSHRLVGSLETKFLSQLSGNKKINKIIIQYTQITTEMMHHSQSEVRFERPTERTYDGL